ncbi:tripartite tricarboxylate transporter substrate binding protein [Acidovorax sp.]|uniref:Bug family tripartite tricarboxylate transporter substrate binding protein n=1 Tax=Acidovorax sp. TaxID=1872122 RepID=UPI0025B992D8|nr:tripartite tricarboxylate transporter substrate binding protein [Acidovorax sp.]MCI5068727.1 tripartite tricarboxylate transporter substrate binding protein [Acidovorax sp.]HTH09272.1 tripartite tricarboxylate transporter substrate binding protein [Acidovorax sp.]
MTPISLPLHRIARRSLLALGGAMLAASAWAQADWPGGKLITWVVPYPAGGSTDVLGRNIAQRLGPALATNVIVDNKAGATGTIGAAFVAKAQPDGLTLLGTSIGPQAIAPHLMAKLPYDHITAFEPVVTIGTIPHILVVGTNQPFKTVADLLAAAKAQPGKLAFASGGNGTILQMQGELLQQQTGVRFIHVPYKGDTPALQDTLAEQVQFMFAPAAAALPHVQAGKLRALAVTSAQRLKALPEVPTMGEAGMKDFVVEQWQAVFAPAKTPAPVVQRLNQEINKTLKDPAVAALADKLGVTLVGGTPQQLGDLQKADSAKWAKVIKDGNIKAD